MLVGCYITIWAFVPLVCMPERLIRSKVVVAPPPETVIRHEAALSLPANLQAGVVVEEIPRSAP